MTALLASLRVYKLAGTSCAGCGREEGMAWVRDQFIEDAGDANFLGGGHGDSRPGRRGRALSALRMSHGLPTAVSLPRRLRFLRKDGGAVAGKFLHVYRLSQDLSG